MIKAVVFDMDGIMFDTERIGNEAWTQLGKEYGYDNISEILPKLMGLTAERMKKTVSQYMGDNFPYDEFMTRSSEYSHAYIREHGLPVKKGLYELLKYLKKNHYKTAVATSTRKESAMRHFEEAKVLEYFDVILCGDMIQNGKPEPDIYLKAAELLHMKPEECVALEDSPNGLLSAYRAGLRPVMVPDQVPSNPELEKLYYAKADSLLDVMGLLEQWRREAAEQIKIQLIALDMDGTTLNDDHKTISPRNIEAIQKAIAKGVYVVPATGRVKASVPEAITSVPGVRYAITSNGASVVDLQEDKVIYSNLIPEETTRELLEKLKPLHVLLQVYIEGQMYLEKEAVKHVDDCHIPQYFIDLMKKKHIAVDSLEEEVIQKHRQIEKINIPTMPDITRSKILEVLSGIRGITITSSIAMNIEINGSNADKGDGLAHLCEHLGISQENVMAVGDSDNDLRMLRAAGFSVAVENGADEVKEVVDIVTLPSYEDGVAHAIETYALHL